MRLIDADALEEKIKEWLTPSKYDEDEFITVTDALVSTMMTIEEQPTVYNVDKVVEQLEKELKLADGEKERCSRENQLQFDCAKGYAHGIAVAIEIMKAGVIE